MPEIVEIKGVGPVLAKACMERGFESVQMIATATVAELATISGVGEARAQTLIDAAQTLLDGMPASQAVNSVNATPDTVRAGNKSSGRIIKAKKKKKEDSSKGKKNSRNNEKKKNKKNKKNKKKGKSKKGKSK